MLKTLINVYLSNKLFGYSNMILNIISILIDRGS